MTSTINTIVTTPVYDSSTEDFLITANGGVDVSGAYALRLVGQAATLDGFIRSGGADAVIMAQNQEQSSSLTVNTTGYVIGRSNAITAAAGSTIINAGAILTLGYGNSQYSSAIYVGGANITISNSGTIEALQGTGISTQSPGQVDITNSGYIKGQTVAIRAGDGADIVRNSGLIASETPFAIDFFGGSDTYDGRNGGIVRGLINLGGDADQAFGGESGDNIFGGSGNDWLDGGLGADTLNGGSDWDVASYITMAAASGGITVDLTTNQNGGAAAGDKLLNIEVVQGTNFNDEITGIDGNGVELLGEAGNDRLFGKSGSDILKGGVDNDMLDGGSGTDKMEGGSGN
ncbi:hypothetical protein AA309_29065, partial [Microvirga vignae]